MRQELSTKEYIFKSIAWNIIVLALYSTLFFEEIPSLDGRTSYLILSVSVITNGFIHTALTIDWRMNSLSAVLGSVIPEGIYTYIANRERIPGLFWIAVFTTVLGCVNICLIMKSKLKTRELRKRIRIKAKLAFLTTRWLVIFTTIFLVLCVSCYQYIVNGPDISDKSLRIEEFRVEDHMDTIQLLKTWSDLSCEQRKEVIQVIARIEASNMGYYQDLTIRYEYMWDDERVLGYFNEPDYAIVIAKDLLYDNSPKRIVTTLLHEIKHLEQYKIYEVYKELPEADKELSYFEKGAIYEKAFTNYISAKNSTDPEVYEKYKNQVLELEAVAFQQERWEFYIDLLGDGIYLDGYYYPGVIKR